MKTELTPAEAARRAYFESLSSKDEWQHTAKAAIDAHLANVKEGLPTVEEMEQAFHLAEKFKFTEIRNLFAERFAKLEASLSQAKSDLETARKDRNKWIDGSLALPPPPCVAMEDALAYSAWIDPQQRQPEYTGKYLVWTSEGPDILTIEEGHIEYADGEIAAWDEITAWSEVKKPSK